MNHLTYTMVDGFRLPNLLPPQTPSVTLGKYSLMRLNFLKENRRVMYTNLLTSGRLNQHLQEIQESAQNRVSEMIQKMMETEGVTEKMKAQNQMQWVGLMNNFRQTAEESVLRELIYS